MRSVRDSQTRARLPGPGNVLFGVRGRRMSADTSRRGLTSEASAIRYDTEDGPRRVDPSDLAFRYDDASARPAESSSLPELDLVGAGNAYEDCGTPRPVKFCEDCGEPVWGRRSCRRPRCPECWESWARKRCISAAAKLEERRAQVYNQQGKSPKFHHVALSPPPGFEVANGSLSHAFDISKSLLEELGATEGYLIYHPYRIKPEYREKYRWADILDMPEEERSKYLVFAPHFHAFVLSHYVTGGDMTKELEERTGWIVERITKGDSNVSLFNLTDLVAATAYCFSHAGIDRLEDSDRVNPQKTARYFGETANTEPRDFNVRKCEDAAADACPRVLGIECPRGTHERARYYPSTDTTANADTNANVPGPAFDAPAPSDLRISEPAPETPSPETRDSHQEENTTETTACGGRLRDFWRAPRDVCNGEIDNPPPDLLRAVGIYIVTK